jgi:hypothetical protein
MDPPLVVVHRVLGTFQVDNAANAAKSNWSAKDHHFRRITQTEMLLISIFLVMVDCTREGRLFYIQIRQI